MVIDNSGYTPSQVKPTAELLKAHVKQYIFISSIAVYADFTEAGIDEDYKLAALKDPTTEEVNGETYGALKVLCEKVVREDVRKRGNIIRPTYIAGPGDPTDRFTYWPLRVSRAARCSRPARRAIRSSTSTCATSPISCAPASKVNAGATTSAVRRAPSPWDRCSRRASASPARTRRSCGRARISSTSAGD